MPLKATINLASLLFKLNSLLYWHFVSQHLQETMGEADDEDEDSDDSEDDDDVMKDEFKFHLKAEGEAGGLLANPNAPVTLSVVEGTNEITGEPTRVEFDPLQPLTTEIMGGEIEFSSRRGWIVLPCCCLASI